MMRIGRVDKCSMLDVSQSETVQCMQSVSELSLGYALLYISAAGRALTLQSSSLHTHTHTYAHSYIYNTVCNRQSLWLVTDCVFQADLRWSNYERCRDHTRFIIFLVNIYSKQLQPIVSYLVWALSVPWKIGQVAPTPLWRQFHTNFGVEWHRCLSSVIWAK